MKHPAFLLCLNPLTPHLFLYSVSTHQSLSYLSCVGQQLNPLLILTPALVITLQPSPPNNIIYGHQIFEVDSFRYQFEIVDNKMPAPVLIWCWISKQAKNILKAH